MDKKNLANIRQNFAQTVFTHQVQELAAYRKSSKADRQKKQNIVIVAIVLVMLVLQSFFPENLTFTYLGTALTVIEVVVLISQLTFNVEQESVSHKNAALKYMSLRGKYSLLIADIMSKQIGPDTIKTRRNVLQEEYQDVSDMSPQTDYEDYKLAQSRLGLTGGDSEQFTWSDAEIDRFLPKGLQSTDIE